ncbi:MAG: hypothetical protein RMJ97_01915 [Raineya sp.]|nr:hypothetical protein [Raineya sp.]
MGYNYAAEAHNAFSFTQEAQIFNETWNYSLFRGLHQFGVYVSRVVLPEVSFLPISKERGLHLLVFDVEVITGLNNNNFWTIPPTYSIEKRIDDFNYFTARTNEVRGYNVSATIGLRFQFKHFARNTVALSVLYRKGLQPLQETIIAYTLQ